MESAVEYIGVEVRIVHRIKRVFTLIVVITVGILYSTIVNL